MMPLKDLETKRPGCDGEEGFPEAVPDQQRASLSFATHGGLHQSGGTATGAATTTSASSCSNSRSVAGSRTNTHTNTHATTSASGFPKDTNAIPPAGAR